MRNDAPADAADYWPEGRSYGLATATAHARRTAADPRDEPAADYYTYDGTAGSSGWGPRPGERWHDDERWQDWEQWQEQVEPPDLHPDHPSAPVPMVQFPGWEETHGDRYRAGESGRFPGPGSVRFRSGRSLSRDSLWTEQVLTLSDGHPAQLTREAQDHAAAIRDSAEREAAAITQQATGQASAIRDAAEHEAAAIRDAAEREAAELRARLDSMWDELSRVAAYVTENLGGAAAIAPVLPEAGVAPPGATSARPTATSLLPGPSAALPLAEPARPETRPAKPHTRPRTSPDRPGRPETAPAKNPQKRPRQQRAMRIATYSTAALLAFATIAGATEIGMHGFRFFVFREGGQGQSTDNSNTDQTFLAHQAAAAHHGGAPRGRHHKTSSQATGSTTNN